MTAHWKKLVWGVLGAMGLLAGTVLYVRYDILRDNRADLAQSHRISVEKIKTFRDGKEDLIQMIAEHPDVLNYLSNATSGAKPAVQKLFYQTLKARRDVMQIRILSNEGMELIRVDRTSEGKLTLVNDRHLQNKSDRDYFIRFSALKEGTIGFSALDLNIEHGKVELPWKPTLRLGMPVFIHHHKKGVIVINLLMNPFLEDLRTRTTVNLSLIDERGYYLLHPNPANDWSFYHVPPVKESIYYPLWKGKNLDRPISYKDQLAFSSILFDNEKVLFIYTPKTPPWEVFKEKALLYTLAQLIAFALILIPAIWLIRRSMTLLQMERDKLTENQHYLENVLDNSFDAMVVIDAQAIILRVNKATRDLFGYRTDEMVGQNVNILVPEPDHSLHDGYVRNYKTIATRIIGKERKLRALHKDGTLIPISLAITPLKLKNSLSFIGTIRDLSEIIALEANQREQENMMMHQAKLASMGEMIGAIAHQWRQPLNSIGLIIQELYYLHQDKALDDTSMKENRDAIMSQLRYMSQTIDDFRNFFSKNKEKETFNAIAVIHELEHLFLSQLKAYNISILLMCKEEENENLFRCLEMDDTHARKFEMFSYPSELKQVLLNLLTNAKDAIIKLQSSDDQQRQITITLSKTEETIIFEICDLAGGIEPQVADRLFEPYFTTKEMGTGLGLYIGKILTDKYLLGTLSFRNHTLNGKRGSCFTLQVRQHNDIS